MKRRVSTQAIEAAIATLYASRSSSPTHDPFPSVREIAQTLKEQFGSSGENKRLCEALRRARQSGPPPEHRAGELVSAAWKARAMTLARDFAIYRSHTDKTIVELRQNLEAMTARAERSEFREDATQSRCLMELDTARQQLANIEARRPRGVDPDVHLNVCRELALAKQELADLKARKSGAR